MSDFKFYGSARTVSGVVEVVERCMQKVDYYGEHIGVVAECVERISGVVCDRWFEARFTPDYEPLAERFHSTCDAAMALLDLASRPAPMVDEQSRGGE